MDALTFDLLFKALAVVIVVWKGFEELGKMGKAITDRHDRERKWDETAREIKEEREKIVERYDEKLEELEEKIVENHCDTEAKIQELRTELLILTKCMSAVLDGLKQLNCNGAVTEAKKTLDEFLVSRI